MAEKRAKMIFDLVDGIQGTYVKTITEGVNPDNLDLKNPCRIAYHPLTSGFSSLRKEASYFFGRGSVEVTNRVYPKDAILHIPRSNESEKGVPSEVVVITEDQRGNQYWLDKIHNGFEDSIAEMSERLSREEKGRMEQEIAAIEKDEESKQDKGPKRNRRRNRGGPAELDDLF